MGRKPLPEDERKVRLNIRLKKKYVDILKAKKVNISEMVEKWVEEWLKKNNH